MENFSVNGLKTKLDKTKEFKEKTKREKVSTRRLKIKQKTHKRSQKQFTNMSRKQIIVKQNAKRRLKEGKRKVREE